MCLTLDEIALLVVEGGLITEKNRKLTSLLLEVVFRCIEILVMVYRLCCSYICLNMVPFGL